MKLKSDFREILIKFTRENGSCPKFKIVFKGVRNVRGSGASFEKSSIKSLNCPLNMRVAGGGHENHCFVYYVFMTKALQDFWRANTELEQGSTRTTLLERLLII